jgi:hypothetical protein
MTGPYLETRQNFVVGSTHSRAVRPDSRVQGVRLQKAICGRLTDVIIPMSAPAELPSP